jgi:hypothetical protein
MNRFWDFVRVEMKYVLFRVNRWQMRKRARRQLGLDR